MVYIKEDERKNVKEYIKTLEPITDFSTLKKGDKIFNKESLRVDYVDTFDHVETWGDREIVFYINSRGEMWNGEAQGYWYYVK